MSAVDAKQLWTSADLPRWDDALRVYPEVVAHQDAKNLVELDRWYREELPGAIAARTPPSVGEREVVDVTRWKMLRGEWRARNLLLLQSNGEVAIRAAAEEAFGLAPDPRKPVARLAQLAGVGPATASAVLAAFRGDCYPFLDELVGAAIPELGEPKFTVPYYLRYAEALRERAEALGAPWTAQTVGFALWSAAGGKAG
ncbi:MAG: hypothetical protein QOF51_4078 [Chloroflexota bacterium]|jgi:hypothetical protein|nr:hypothetical protein [Chloroflexota bacterium]